MRIEGWESRLHALLAQAQSKPYQLGSWDCFRLACAVIEALTGVERWTQFEGKYATPREAKRLIARRGRSFEAAGDSFFGPSVNVRLARRGDIVALQTADGEKHLGVVTGAQAAFLSPSGLVYVPVLTCLTAWKVG